MYFWLSCCCSCIINSAVSGGFEEWKIPFEERRSRLANDGLFETMPIGILVVVVVAVVDLIRFRELWFGSMMFSRSFGCGSLPNR